MATMLLGTETYIADLLLANLALTIFMLAGTTLGASLIVLSLLEVEFMVLLGQELVLTTNEVGMAFSGLDNCGLEFRLKLELSRLASRLAVTLASILASSLVLSLGNRGSGDGLSDLDKLGL
jgi:hypothetical protein